MTTLQHAKKMVLIHPRELDKVNAVVRERSAREHGEGNRQRHEKDTGPHDLQTGNNNRETLYSAISGLDERSKDILQRRWLNDENKATLHEVAAEYGVSAERIRQIEKRAMEKMKGQLTL